MFVYDIREYHAAGHQQKAPCLGELNDKAHQIPGFSDDL
jgi:hypothetical protein